MTKLDSSFLDQDERSVRFVNSPGSDLLPEFSFICLWSILRRFRTPWRECCDQWNASIFPCSCWVSFDDRNSFGKRYSFNEAFIISNLRASNSYAWRCGKIGDITNKNFFRFPCAANKVLFVVRWFYIFLESSFHHFGHWGLSDYIFIFPRIEKSGLYAPWRQYFSILGLLTLTFEAMDYW